MPFVTLAFLIADLAPDPFSQHSLKSSRAVPWRSFAGRCGISLPAMQKAERDERTAHILAQEKTRKDFKESLDLMAQTISSLAVKKSE